MAHQHTGSSDTELGRFWRARRTQTGPGQVSLAIGTGLRRTRGPRRQEPATAGISLDYHVCLEPRRHPAAPYALT
jgi:hypothetical protein